MPRQQPQQAYRGYRTAGIRLSEELDPDAVAPGLAEPDEFLAASHQFDKAHVVMLTERQLIPTHAGASILSELRATEAGDVVAHRSAEGGGRHAGEQHLIRALGEDVGGHINLGRSTGDIGATARRLVHRAQLVELVAELSTMRTALLDLAGDNTETIIPGHTHGQVAQATTLAHWLTMWTGVFTRDAERAFELYDRVNVSPAGSGIMTGSELPIDRERTAELLGFAGPIRNTMDAVHSHDTDCLETAAFLAIVAANLGRLAEDLQLWFTSEFGLVDVPDRFCGTSSIMPQKRNPDSPEAVKGVANLAMSSLTSAFFAEKGPTAYSFRERRVTDTTNHQAFGLVTSQLSATAVLIRHLAIDTERALELTRTFWAQAADLAVAISRHAGLPWRSAHQIVGILVRMCEQRGLESGEVTTELVDEAAVVYFDRPVRLPSDVLDAALDPHRSVKARTLTGGPSPRAVHDEMFALRSRVSHDDDRLEHIRECLGSAHTELETAIDRILMETRADR